MKKVIMVLTILFMCTGFALAEDVMDGRFIAYDDGTVLDSESNLLWAARDNGRSINWADAKFYCESYDGVDTKTGGCPRPVNLKVYITD